MIHMVLSASLKEFLYEIYSELINNDKLLTLISFEN